MRNPLLRLLVAIPLAGMLIAGAVTAAWLAMGAPAPARATTWFRVQHIASSASYADTPTAPFYVLVLGNDHRPGQSGLGDAIHVIGVNPATGDASMLDVPRDTEAPGGGKINSYHNVNSGGLGPIVGQLNRMMGINISYAITTDFAGFIAMVDEIGGVDLEITEPMHDSANSGANWEPGTYKMSGDWLLAYSRNRYTVPGGDLGRTFNQGRAIIAALATLRAQNPGAAGTARLVATLARHVQSDGMDLGQMYALGRLALSIDPARVKNVVIPTGGGSGTNLSVGAGAQDLFADFRDDAILQAH